jgi:thiol-disulfide isomerase/thioredoxin
MIKPLRRLFMKKRFFSLLMYFFIMTQIVQAADRIPLSGEAFPDILISAPEKPSEREYLGLTGEGPFKISQIKGDLAIVEIFSMYCPYCQKEAPIVNELYELINKNILLKNRIKIIGVGAGNTPFEVNVFRDKYSVRFPLIPDESFTVHKAVGEVRTPYFFVIDLNPDRAKRLVYSKVGSIHDANQFIENILHDSGLK